MDMHDGLCRAILAEACAELQYYADINDQAVRTPLPVPQVPGGLVGRTKHLLRAFKYGLSDCGTLSI